jgi:hypothetical protein
MKAKVNTETLKHVEAFETYYWMGDQRSLSGVARKVKVTVQAVAKWSTSFSWNERVKERDEKVIKKLRSRSDAEAMAVKERQLQIVRATQTRYAQRLASEENRSKVGASKYEPNANDAIRAMRHEQLLTGQATSRPEVLVNQQTLDGVVASIIALLRRKLPASCPHCKTSLDLPRVIGRELLDLSRRVRSAVGFGPSDDGVADEADGKDAKPELVPARAARPTSQSAGSPPTTPPDDPPKPPPVT